MDINQQNQNTWNKLALMYQEKFMDLDLYNTSYDRFCQLIQKLNPSILEIGCGPGNITKYLLSQRKDFKILATDIAPNMVKLAKQNNPLAEVKVLDSRSIHQLPQTFDAIVSGFCIPYLSPEDCSKFIKNANQLLHPNGLLYLSFVEGQAEQSGYQTGSTGDRLFFYFHELARLKKDFNLNHFSIIDSFEIEYSKSSQQSETHTVLILKKQIHQ